MSLYERVKDLGVELENIPAERLVITGMSTITPLGDKVKTLAGLNAGTSGVIKFDAKNFSVNIAAPVIFDPDKYFSKKEVREMSRLGMMAIVIAREAMQNAGLLGNDGTLRKDMDRRSVAPWVGSGIGSLGIINAYLHLHKTDKLEAISRMLSDQPDIVKANSRRLFPRIGFTLFPEEPNAGVANALQISGWGGSSVEACATGLSNIIEGTRTVREGLAKVAVTGGFEDILSEYPELCIAIFAAMRTVLSKRNDEPEKASRPFDIERDGFVFGAGGAIVIVEELKHAKKREAPILAEILGFSKSVDGIGGTDLDPKNVAATILRALYNKNTGGFYPVDSIFAHATSTIEGDKNEVNALRLALGDDYLKTIPIAAIKGNIGHLAGGAGAVNAIAAINALITGKIPPILNLVKPGPEFAGLNLVRGTPLERTINTALVLAYGFGGHNAVMLLGKYNNLH
jgi:3-oxoacyl-[acyl-carrier-protein] synthase II